MNRSIINQLELYEGKKLSEETLKVKTTDETIKQQRSSGIQRITK